MIAAGVLSSCYTNHSQRWLEKHRVYEGYALPYKRSAHGAVQPGRLNPVIYRAGNEWYLAGIRSEYAGEWQNEVHFLSDDFDDRHASLSALPGHRRIYYHRISPRSAATLCSSDAPTYLDIRSLIARGRGGWVPALPRGARAVHAPALGKCVYPERYIERVARSSAPWYNYVGAGFSFVAEDIPLTICWSAAYVLSYPVFLAIGRPFTRKR